MKNCDGNCKNCSNEVLEFKEGKVQEVQKPVPSHYDISGIPPTMDIINAVVKHNTEDVTQAGYLFNLLKYVFRWGKKDGLKDLYKAKDFLERLIGEVKCEK